MKMVLSQTRGADTHFLLPDVQNSTRGLVDDTGLQFALYSYDAFGNLTEDTSSGQTTYLYTGQQYDPFSELYSLRARYYGAGIGRFLARDTYPYNYQNPFELNRYVYTANNPVMFSDPSGYFANKVEYKPAESTALITANNTANVAYKSWNTGYVMGRLAAKALIPIIPWLLLRILDPFINNNQPDTSEPHEEGEQSGESAPKPEWDKVKDWDRLLEDYPDIMADGLDMSTVPLEEYYEIKTEEDVVERDGDYSNKDIALSRGDAGGMGSPFGLLQFSANVRTVTNRTVVPYPEWYLEGITDDDVSMPGWRNVWESAFMVAVTRAEKIHFNLEDLTPNPIQYAEQYGGRGDFSQAQFTTAWELYVIRHSHLCEKTHFYENGTGNIREVPRSTICVFGAAAP